ncbi:replication factor A protein 3 [Colletotrichum spaethianum]|uniref:Replication factor A protein 3 n=1 Tax=Colletotrichum spaethianum TaxID=700344 RepID=A0AA37P892_9PEZI|nr:replication factor A protein 3 [Colletotrichum spaethianum]GKT47467.1 replication factor A protein 3 [Colletotrichum spaethianum]
MTSYGGFTKTAYGAQGGDDAGGFVYGGSQQGSQGGGKAYSEESLRPVTIKQIIDADEAYPGADFKIDGATVTQVTFVAQIRQISPQPTNITLKLDDGTGLIEVKKWVDTDKKDDADANLELDGHVRVWGRLKSFNGKRHVGAHFIRPVTDFNEVNYHLLEATYVHLYFTKGPLNGAGGADGANGAGGGGGGDGMFVDGGDSYGGGAGTGAGGNSAQAGKLRGCSPAAQKMFNFINNAPGGNEGVHLNQISSGAGISMRDVLAAADELLGQGLIYTTIDDETWAILDY